MWVSGLANPTSFFVVIHITGLMRSFTLAYSVTRVIRRTNVFTNSICDRNSYSRSLPLSWVYLNDCHYACVGLWIDIEWTDLESRVIWRHCGFNNNRLRGFTY